MSVEFFGNRQIVKSQWQWFNKKSLVHLHVFRTGDVEDCWVVTRGKPGDIRYRVSRCRTLSSAVESLTDAELESLVSELRVSPLVILALAAQDGGL